MIVPDVICFYHTSFGLQPFQCFILQIFLSPILKSKIIKQWQLKACFCEDLCSQI
uniref:Uncharacterized protein n=1 Tax=Anguilla anguilla TaxID=7936 RepID=A0A0E9VD26_ANGAN